jgi:hypothetical protein
MVSRFRASSVVISDVHVRFRVRAQYLFCVVTCNSASVAFLLL